MPITAASGSPRRDRPEENSQNRECSLVLSEKGRSCKESFFEKGQSRDSGRDVQHRDSAKKTYPSAEGKATTPDFTHGSGWGAPTVSESESCAIRYRGRLDARDRGRTTVSRRDWENSEGLGTTAVRGAGERLL